MSMWYGCRAGTTPPRNCPGKLSTHGRSPRSFASIYRLSITLSSGVRPLRSKAAILLVVLRRVLVGRLISFIKFAGFADDHSIFEILAGSGVGAFKGSELSRSIGAA